MVVATKYKPWLRLVGGSTNEAKIRLCSLVVVEDLASNLRRFSQLIPRNCSRDGAKRRVFVLQEALGLLPCYSQGRALALGQSP